MLYRTLLRPALFRLEPETAHKLALRSLKLALGTQGVHRAVARRFTRAPFGELRRFGLTFKNPVGLAAGFDKNGAHARELAALGFGFIEVGTVTHLAQPGNPRPRLFRLPADRALINRQGFNNEGAAALASRLARDGRPACVLGVNIGKSRAIGVEAAIPDYLASFDLVRDYADYVTINVSSPNTPHLRELQRADALAALLAALQQRNREPSRPAGLYAGDAQNANGDAIRAGPPRSLPLFVKVAPDLSEGELEMIVEVARRVGVAGIVATNTTTARSGLRTPAAEVEACGAGGLSGAPLRARSTEIIRTIFRLSRGSLTIIGGGGIFTAEDAWEKVSAGAGLVQLYTGFIYRGVTVARDVNEGLWQILNAHGFKSLDEAVGCRADEQPAGSN